MHGLIPGPSPSTVPPLCRLGRLLCPPSKGLGQYKSGQGSSLKGRAGCSCPCWERWEHPRSLAPAAVMGTLPHLLTPTHFLSIFFCVCVHCAIFILSLSVLLPRRNKGVEMVGPLVLVIRMGERPLPWGLFSVFSLGRPSCSYQSCCPKSEDRSSKRHRGEGPETAQDRVLGCSKGFQAQAEFSGLCSINWFS